MENHQLSSDNPMILEIREFLERSESQTQATASCLQPTGTLAGLLWSMSSKASFAQSMESRP